MGRWSGGSHLLHQISKTLKPNPSKPLFFSFATPSSSTLYFNLRAFSAAPSRVPVDSHEFDSGFPYNAQNYGLGAEEDDDTGKIPIKAYFLSTRYATVIFVLWILSYFLWCYPCGSVRICLFLFIPNHFMLNLMNFTWEHAMKLLFFVLMALSIEFHYWVCELIKLYYCVFGFLFSFVYVWSSPWFMCSTSSFSFCLFF